MYSSIFQVSHFILWWIWHADLKMHNQTTATKNTPELPVLIKLENFCSTELHLTPSTNMQWQIHHSVSLLSNLHSNTLQGEQIGQGWLESNSYEMLTAIMKYSDFRHQPDSTRHVEDLGCKKTTNISKKHCRYNCLPLTPITNWWLCTFVLPVLDMWEEI